MHARIVKAIDEVKVMLDTYSFQTDTTRIKEILYSLQDVDNYDELLIEVNDIGDRCVLEKCLDKSDKNIGNICVMLSSIIVAIMDDSDENLYDMECDINFLAYDYLTSFSKM